jgi:hypothetical protein
MFWNRYGGVVAWLLFAGVILGAAFFLIVFSWLVPPDRGEESAGFMMPFVGAFFGAVTTLAASVTYVLVMGVWTRRPDRPVAFGGWLGAASAAGGAVIFWLVFGMAVSGAHGLRLWGAVGAGCAVIVALIAGPLTVRAARTTDSGDALPAPTI